MFCVTRCAPWPGRIGAGLVALLVVAVMVSYVWVPHDPLHVDPSGRWLPISRDHWFGTDGAGKDLFSQVLVGARVSLFVALASAVDRRHRRRRARPAQRADAAARRRVGRPPDRRAHRHPDARARARPRRAVRRLAVHGVDRHRRRIRRRARPHPARRDRAGAHPGLRDGGPRRPARRRGGRSASTCCPNVAPITIVQLSLVAALAILAEAALSFLGLMSPVAPVVGSHPRRAADAPSPSTPGDHLPRR